MWYEETLRFLLSWIPELPYEKMHCKETTIAFRKWKFDWVDSSFCQVFQLAELEYAQCALGTNHFSISECMKSENLVTE